MYIYIYIYMYYIYIYIHNIVFAHVVFPGEIVDLPHTDASTHVHAHAPDKFCMILA